MKWQISINPTHAGLDKRWMINYSRLSDGTYWPKFLHVTFCYCSCTWAVQLIREVFHLATSFSCWFMVIRILFCIIWSLHSWRSWWSSRQGSWGAITVDAWTFISWCLPGSLMKLSSGKKQNLLSWNYSLQVLDYQDFRTIRRQIKGI